MGLLSQDAFLFSLGAIRQDLRWRSRIRAHRPVSPIFRASLVQTGDTPPARPALEKFLPAENAALRLVGKEVQPAH